jgi:mono/diheme cytochrome c family protein|tara:strand:+ start:334 stop:780 length:447 start_codon:yes stop_codon:yes gene_type:complete
MNRLKPILCVAAALTLAPSGHAGPDRSGLNANRAQNNYMLNCQGCHQADGRGLEGSVPDMRSFVGRFLATAGGREFLVQVPGSANSPLSDAELAELLNWILLTMSHAELPADFQRYSADEVSTLRGQPLIDVDARRAELVLAIEEDAP